MTAQHLATLASLALGSAAFAQPGLPTWTILGDSTPQDLTYVSAASIRGTPVLVWHRDGPDRPPVIAIVEALALRGQQVGMVTWDGVRWESYPAQPQGAITGRSIVFDFDGPGPQPERIVSLAMFNGASRCIFWNGSAWEELPGWTEPSGTPFGALGSHDFDGNGPQLPRLVAANRTVRYWNGTNWIQFGDVAGTVNAYGVTSLQSYDADGSGPALPELYMTGNFASVSGVPSPRLARWNGAAWSAVTGVSTALVPGAMAVHDFDGPGPVAPELVIAGQFTIPFGTGSVVAYNGGSWRVVTAGVFSNTSASTPPGLASINLGGSVNDLLVHGAFTAMGASPLARIARYNAQSLAFEPMSDAPGAGFGDNTVSSVVSADLDGPGPLGASIFATGTFTVSSGRALSTLVRWNGREWQPVTGAFSEPIRSVHVFDLDGDGPAPETTFFLGSLMDHGGIEYGNVATFDGQHMNPMGPVIRLSSGSRFDLNFFDPDADGPRGPELFLATQRGYKWDGSSWVTLSVSTINAMTTHDFDGPGPLAPRLIIAGATAGTGSSVSQYDGSAFTTVGQPLNNLCLKIHSHDIDGDGPTLPYVFAIGSFDDVEGGSNRGAAYFDGAAWRSWNFGYRGATGVTDMASFDLDGAGPRPAELIAASYLSEEGNGGVTAWDGVSMRPLLLDNADEIEVFDGDGDGPGEPVLVAAGWTGPYETRVTWFRQWNTSTQSWDTIASGADFCDDRVFSMAIERPWGRRGPQRLVLAGNFTSMGGLPTVNVGRFTRIGRPWLLEEPADAAVEVGAPIVLRAGVSAAYEGATFQWMRNGVALKDTAVISGSAGTLATRPGERTIDVTLTIGSATADDAGLYTLVLANAAGESTSRAARVAVPCPGDFNGDGLLSSQDFFDFLTAFFAEAPSADINHDAMVSSQDFFDFLTRFFVEC